MMDLIKKNMVVLGVIVLGFLGLVVYLNFFSGGSTNALLSTETEVDSPVSKNLLVVLSNLHTIKLDNSIFTNPAFQSLTNYGVQIPPEPVGRRNPFLPIEGSAPVSPAKGSK